MKAIRVHEFGGPEVLKLEDVPDLQPGPGQVLVQVHAVGVNPVETYIRTGTYATKPTLPYTPGGDGAGVVASVGSGVSSVKPGDRVYTAGSVSGTYAEQTLCNEAQVLALLTAPPIARCFSAVLQGPAKPSWCMVPAGEWVPRLCSWRTQQG